MSGKPTINTKLGQSASIKIGKHTYPAGYTQNQIKSQPVKSGVMSDIKNKAQSTLKSQDDSGSATISNAMTTGSYAYKTFQTAQKVTPGVVNLTGKVARGTYKVAGDTFTVAKTAALHTALLKDGQITTAQYSRYMINTLKNTKPMQNLAIAVKGVKTAVNTAKEYSLKVGYGLKTGYRVASGLVNGTIKIKISKNEIDAIKNIAYKGIKTSKTIVGRSIKTGVNYAGKGINLSGKGLKKVSIKAIKTGTMAGVNYLSQSEDLGIQSFVMGIKTSRFSYKAVKTAPRVLKTTYKGAKTVINAPIKTGKYMYKTGKGIAKGVKATRKYGFKRIGKFYKRKTQRMVAQAGRSIVTAIMNVLKAVARKFMLPVIIVIVCVVVILNVLSAPAGAVASIFGGWFRDNSSGTEFDEEPWLTNKITASRGELVNEIIQIKNDNLVSGGGQYHYVRFFNSFNDTEIELTDVNILTSVYSVQQYYELIQPIFHSVLLTEYELDASESELNNLYNEIWDKLTIIKTQELPLEHCFGATSPCSQCGSYHASTGGCPNYESGTHSSYTCSTCCYHYYTEDEDEDEESTGGSSTTEHDACNGYSYCQGHKILAISLTNSGFDVLLNEYFLNDINSLEAKSSRSEEEETRLSELKDGYEVCMAIVEVVADTMGDKSVVVPFDKVELTEITALACQFIGNPYVWGGNDPVHGIDCSGFVKYVYSNFGVSLPRVAKDQVKCGTTISDIASAKPGDLIFYSKNGTDEGVYHVVMYLGDGLIVHASNSKPYPAGGIKVSSLYGTPYKIQRVY